MYVLPKVVDTAGLFGANPLICGKTVEQNYLPVLNLPTLMVKLVNILG
jgi:hypothetical protein